MKKMLLSLLTLFMLYGKLQAQILYDALQFYDQSITYSYSPADGLSVYEGETKSETITFDFDMKGVTKGYVYFVLSTSPFLNNMDECYYCSLGRLNRKSDGSYFNRKILNLQGVVWYKLLGITGGNVMKGDNNFDGILPKNTRYYHYIILRIYKQGWKYVVVTEKNRTMIDYLTPKPAYDLSLESFSLKESTISTGGSVTATLVFKNVGTKVINGVNLSYYLCDTGTLSATAKKYTLIGGEANIGSLAIGASINRTLSIQIPFNSYLKDYFEGKENLYVIVHAELTTGTESNKKNNTKAVSVQMKY